MHLRRTATPPLFRTCGIAVLLLSGAYAVFQLPSDALYAVLFLAGLIAWTVIAYQIISIMKENSLDALIVPSAAVTSRHTQRATVLPREEAIIIEWATECLQGGHTLEAGLKLERVAPAFREHPDVLQLRLAIYRKEQRWHAALDAAQALSKAAPGRVEGWIGQAICLHELNLTHRAVETLLPVAARHAGDPMVAYHLARFCSELGRLEEAQGWLFKAIQNSNEPQLVSRALQEADLEPLLHFLSRKALVHRIVCGSGAGAERAALEFARTHGIPHGGSGAPDESASRPDLPLHATPHAGDADRIESNIRDSDGTLIFSLAPDLKGSALRTLEIARAQKKPVLHLGHSGTRARKAEQLLSFLQQQKVGTLFVTGATTTKTAVIGDRVKEVLETAMTLRRRAILTGGKA